MNTNFKNMEVFYDVPYDVRQLTDTAAMELLSIMLHDTTVRSARAIEKM